jgi:hypothetical protein
VVGRDDVQLPHAVPADQPGQQLRVEPLVMADHDERPPRAQVPGDDAERGVEGEVVGHERHVGAVGVGRHTRQRRRGQRRVGHHDALGHTGAAGGEEHVGRAPRVVRCVLPGRGRVQRVEHPTVQDQRCPCRAGHGLDPRPGLALTDRDGHGARPPAADEGGQDVGGTVQREDDGGAGTGSPSREERSDRPGPVPELAAGPRPGTVDHGDRVRLLRRPCPELRQHRAHRGSAGVALEDVQARVVGRRRQRQGGHRLSRVVQRRVEQPGPPLQQVPDGARVQSGRRVHRLDGEAAVLVLQVEVEVVVGDGARPAAATHRRTTDGQVAALRVEQVQQHGAHPGAHPLGQCSHGHLQGQPLVGLPGRHPCAHARHEVGERRVPRDVHRDEPGVDAAPDDPVQCRVPSAGDRSGEDDLLLPRGLRQQRAQRRAQHGVGRRAQAPGQDLDPPQRLRRQP